MNTTHRINLARLSLEGLSIGDAFGQCFFTHDVWKTLPSRELPPAGWSYTDDTAMAISIVQALEALGHIDQDDLADRFATAFASEPWRGCDRGAIRMLQDVCEGAPWRERVQAMFDGTGSMGNGSAMRVAPLGAYFANNLDECVEQAILSAQVTHCHPEGEAGAIAIAVAAALSTRVGQGAQNSHADELFDAVISHTPKSETLIGIKQAAVLGAQRSVEDVVHTVGNGSRVFAIDTVPFCLWCAFHHLDSFEDALWTCVSAGGDIDTTTAIVGGIVAPRVGRAGIPQAYIDAREALPLEGTQS